jgi:predicted transcriptional regulator
VIEATFRANLKHGLQASQETKSDYCYWLHITYPTLTQQQIAARVGVTQSTVSRAIVQRKKQLEEVTRQTTQAAEETDDDLEVWKDGLVKRARHFVKSVSKFSETVKGTDNYQTLVHELQLELLREPEDRGALLFTGQVLLDAAQRSKAMRKAKV